MFHSLIQCILRSVIQCITVTVIERYNCILSSVVKYMCQHWISFCNRNYICRDSSPRIKMSTKRITGSSTNSSNGSATASTNSSQERPQLIDVDYVTQRLYYSTGEGKVSGEVTVNDTHSPGGTRKAFVHSIVAWDMRGKKCVFEAWSKHSKNARVYFEYVISLFNRRNL